MATQCASKSPSKSTSTCTEFLETLPATSLPALLKYLLFPSRRSSKHREMSFPPFPKSQSFIDSDSARVVAAYVQERCLAALANTSYDLCHEPCGMTFAKMIRMRTHRTDFCISRNLEALASHSH